MKRYSKAVLWTCVLVVLSGAAARIRDGSFRYMTGYLLGAGVVAAVAGSDLSHVTYHNEPMNQLNRNLAYEADRMDRTPHRAFAPIGIAGLAAIVLALAAGFITR